MTSSSDIGALLQGAGFKLLTVDVDPITVRYPSLFELLHDLRTMGEGNATVC
jgi:NADH dehydrogenase [ubiquinone] 1 alpha subcomplex assembly factor 5